MKALLLAGGRGTRLRPLTYTTNKHLLPIANKPMLERVINDTIELGIKDIIININKGDKELPAVFGNGKRYNAKFTYIEQPEPNGMMYPIKLAEKLIGNEPFFFSAGDNILAGGLKKHMNDFLKNKSDAHVLVVKRPDYQQFGVAIVKGNKVIKTVEKPKKFVSDLVLTAIYFFKPVVFKAFDYVKPIDPQNTGKPEYYPPVVNNWLIENGYTLTCSKVTGWWKDTGAPRDLILANRLVLEKDFETKIKGKLINTNFEGNVEIEKGAKCENCEIRGPVVIGKNCKIKNSYIGPYTSIGDNCELENIQIENSIVMNNTILKDHPNRIDSSLFGTNVVMDKTVAVKGTYSYVIGDNSQIKY